MIMRKMVVFVFITSVTTMLNAQDEPAKLDLSGYLLTDHRAVVGGETVKYNWQEYRLSLQGEYKMAGKARFYSETWARELGFPSIQRLADLQSGQNLSPIDLSLREAYVELYNCGINRLDIKIGRQRIAWGTGDKINPTDNFDADDLEDIWDFGRHLSSNGLKATYYLPDFSIISGLSISGVFVPQFTPALLPRGEWLEALMPSQELPPGMDTIVIMRSAAEHFDMPSQRPQESSSGGIRIGGRLAEWDVSLSYAYTREHFPVIYKTVITPFAIVPLPMTIDADVHLKYPRIHVAGIDFAGALASIGVWAEAGIFFPEKVMAKAEFPMQQILSLPADQLQQLLPLMSGLAAMTAPDTVLSGDPYVKFVVGADYTFSANVYVNMQYIHGFVHEMGDSLEDYIMGSLDWRLFDEKLVLSPLGVGLEIKDWGEFADNYAFIGQPGLRWKPADNAEISLGGRVIMGKATTRFGKLEDNDEVFVLVKYSF